jgi:hypothetical protein
MAKPKSKSQPTWTDVKARLADFDGSALLGLIQSLYAALDSKGNIFGTTSDGGTYNSGVAFEVTP